MTLENKQKTTRKVVSPVKKKTTNKTGVKKTTTSKVAVKKKTSKKISKASHMKKEGLPVSKKGRLIALKELERIEGEFELSHLEGKVLRFARAYIACGRAWIAAKVLTESRSRNYLYKLGSFYLCKLRKEEWFLNSIGMGWQDFAQVVTRLRQKPRNYSDIFLKLQREDVQKFDITNERSVINIIRPPRPQKKIKSDEGDKK